MASGNFSEINSIYFHVNKAATEYDTSESKNHVLLPFPNEDEGLPTKQLLVLSARTTTTTNSTKNVNKNSI